MATATAVRAAITSVTVELTLNEAETLRDIARKVGGSPGTNLRKLSFSRRAFVDRIDAALEEAGVRPSGDGSAGDSSIYFQNIEELEA